VKDIQTARLAAVSTTCVTDAELVVLARAGDAGAFGVLVERHQRAARRAAVAALGSQDEADEVVQEALIAAFRQLGGFRGEASFKTWLLTITWRKALDRRGSLARRLRRFVAIDAHGWDLQRDRKPSQEKTLIEAEAGVAVRRLVAKLPARLRDPLLLSASGDYTMDEIAQALRLPVGTVKWRVFEARRLLKKKLAGLGYGNEQPR
jgi:RNA polymerase sigma factor (sigma-70 family)